MVVNHIHLPELLDAAKDVHPPTRIVGPMVKSGAKLSQDIVDTLH